jgi:hypothetical protein
MKYLVVALAVALIACSTSNIGKPIASDKCERAFVRMLPVLQRVTARHPREEIEACRQAELRDPTRDLWLDCILSVPSGQMTVQTIQDCQGKDRQARGASSIPSSSSTSPPSTTASSSSSSDGDVSH